MNRTLVGLLVLLSCLSASLATGQVTVLGPRPYLSRGDSPFPVQAPAPDFFLEDFEDGVFNLPRVTLPSPLFAGLGISFPSQSSDSVDADDGVIDGLGRQGHSGVGALLPLAGPENRSEIEFAFDPLAGVYPKSLGFVLTDGPIDMSLSLRVVLSDDTIANVPLAPIVLDDSGLGETAEDRFYGVASGLGFKGIKIIASTPGDWIGGGIEIDHVQYGYRAIPEPGSLALAILACGCAFVRSRMKRA